jgi:hypothetical protein
MAMDRTVQRKKGVMYTGIKYALLYVTSDHFHYSRTPCVCILHCNLSQTNLKYIYIYIHKHNR